MKYLKIQNNGELDIRLVALMGGTTKANDAYKIGQFGTGLKYTLAWLFRNNIDFKIYSGVNAVNVSTITETIGNTEFEIICINDNRTSITTGMGLQWSAWMILRELWCNALDEGGQEKDVVNDEKGLSGMEGTTTFFIQITPELQEVLDNWGKYFIQDEEPIWENDLYAIYHNTRKEKLCLYKNGVLIYQHPETISLFRYDIKTAEINELREFKGMVHYSVLNALENPNSDVTTYFLHNIKEEYFEGSELDYDWFARFADTWRAAIGGGRIIGTGGFRSYDNYGVEVDLSNVIELPKKVYQYLTKRFEGVGALAMSDDNTEFYETSLPDLEGKVNYCIELLKGKGYTLSEACKIKYGFFPNKELKIAANREKKWLMISDTIKSLQTEAMCSLIIENNEYITLNCSKDSIYYREHFINLYARALLSKNEIEI